jgi:hypothetical protein
MNAVHRAYHAGLRRFLVSTFPAWQAVGVHVTRNHFYEPVPDTRRLPGTLWSKPGEMAGVKIPSFEEQEEKIKCITQFRSEYDDISSSLRGNRFISQTASALYYGLVRAYKPSRIIEIGAGFSTVLACGAVERNCGTVIAIDPYPAKNIPKQALIIPLRVQDVPLGNLLNFSTAISCLSTQAMWLRLVAMCYLRFWKYCPV